VATLDVRLTCINICRGASAILAASSVRQERVMNEPTSGPAYVGPDYPRWTQTLADGRQVVIRPLSRRDAAAERSFIEGLSDQSRRYRFLGQVPHPSDEFIEQLTDIDYANDVALAAVVQDDGGERIVGVSRYAADSTRERGECAVVVADEWQHKGLGTALMRHLIGIAQDRGLRLLESTDMSENGEMRELARDLGFHCRVDPEDAHQVIYGLPLPGPSRVA
jgi:GNAT superfamily N-acetyltransferase